MNKEEHDKLQKLIEEVFLNSVSRKIKFDKSIAIGKLTVDGKNFLHEISGLDFKEDVRFYLHPCDIYHIYSSHFGGNEDDSANLVPLKVEDIKSIADILSQPDAVAYLGEDKKGKKFAFFLQCPSGSYNLIEVYAQKRCRLTTKTLYNTKKSVSQSAMILLAQTSETYGAALFDANIPILFEFQQDIIDDAFFYLNKI